jgi:four helix bundle protein
MKNKADKGYHKLLVWQRARELLLLVYKYTEDFPKSEEFGLKSQLRRAAVSVILTLVEGYRRHSTKDYLHFLNMSETSLDELEAAFEICLDLKYFTDQSYEELENKKGEVAYLLGRLVESIRNKNDL